MDIELRIGRWAVEPRSGQLANNGKILRIKPKVMRLLVHFARYPGEVLTKGHLLKTLWNDSYVTENTLSNAISELRRALGDDARDPAFIETLPKRGYRMIAPVSGAGNLDSGELLAGTEPPTRFLVLPFECLSGETSECHLADVLTVCVSTVLAQRPTICVVSRASTLAASRETQATLPELARRLEAERILEGSLVPSQNGRDLVVRLYDDHDHNLWTKVYGVREADQLQELAHQVVEQLPW